jgi:hypothetical protein
LGLGILPPFLAPYKSINSDTCSQYKLEHKNKFLGFWWILGFTAL